MASPRIRRGFVDLAEGQLHLRSLDGSPGAPVVLLHQASGSSRQMEPLMPGFARHRQVIALDLPGNGDSCPPVADDIDMAGYADAVIRALDTLGHHRVALYGFHAGASVAAEVAIARPDLVEALILDSVGLYSAAETEEMLTSYLPAIRRHPHGLHLVECWNYVRDTYLFWPWFKTDAAHARAVGLPPLDDLDAKVLEVVKGLDHFAKLYAAAFRHDKEARFPLVRCRTLVTAGASNSQREKLERVAGLIAGAETMVTPGVYDRESAAQTGRLLGDWLAAG
ncbi:MAG: alpha/beta fold hydrolase [Azospirillaceae bacterium]